MKDVIAGEYKLVIVAKNGEECDIFNLNQRTFTVTIK